MSEHKMQTVARIKIHLQPKYSVTHTVIQVV